MLSLALGATLVGFVLLVIGLITGTVWLAVACIVVCLIGLGFLIADIVRSGRGDDGDARSSTFTGSGESEDAGSEDPGSEDPGSEDTVSTQTAPKDTGSEDSGKEELDPEQQRAQLWRGVVDPTSGEPAPDTSGTSIKRKQGTYDDYLRAVGDNPDEVRTPGTSAPPSTPGQQAPGQPTPPGQQAPRRPVPPEPSAPDDPDTDTFPAQSAGENPHSGGQKIDPLHPDWRPPSE